MKKLTASETALELKHALPQVPTKRSRTPNRELVGEIKTFKVLNQTLLVESTGKRKGGYSVHKYSLIGQYVDGEHFSFPIPARLAQHLRQVIAVQG